MGCVRPAAVVLSIDIGLPLERSCWGGAFLKGRVSIKCDLLRPGKTPKGTHLTQAYPDFLCDSRMVVAPVASGTLLQCLWSISNRWGPGCLLFMEWGDSGLSSWSTLCPSAIGIMCHVYDINKDYLMLKKHVLSKQTSVLGINRTRHCWWVMVTLLSQWFSMWGGGRAVVPLGQSCQNLQTSFVFVTTEVAELCF